MIDAVVLAIGLSMDATAVSAATGAAGAGRRIAFRMAWLFGLFHIVMTTAGWLVGEVAANWVASWDHWLAFGLLGVIGGKMTWSAMHPDPEDTVVPAGWGMLFGLGLATSVDAIAAGVTLPFVDAPELVMIGAIGGTVFVFVLIGSEIGTRLGDRFGRAFQIIGGVAIIALGIKTLVQHLTA